MPGEIPTSPKDIQSTVAAVFALSQSADRALRGYNGEIGLVAEVDKLKEFIQEFREERKNRDKENRAFMRSIVLIGLAELLGVITTIILFVTHIK